MQITRRHVIALSAATAAAGAIGAGGLGLRWWNQSPDGQFAALSEEEAEIVRAIAGAAYPPTTTIPLNGADAGLDRFFDAMLTHIPQTTRKLLKLLLHGLDGGVVLTHGTTFAALDSPTQSEVLEEWLNHDLADLRNAAQSLVLLLGMGWSIHPQVAPTMQRYHSCGYGT